MHRRCPRLAVAGVTFAVVLAPGVPASAAVTYDPSTMTGLVGPAEVRRAFGWTSATLAERADGVAFDHNFWTDDTYALRCGAREVPLVHHRAFGRYELTEAVVRRDRPRSSTGYGTGITGFRLAGADFGISGTSVAPAVGQPCPADQAPGTTIGALRLVSTVTGWSLGVSAGAVHRELLAGRAES